MKTSRRNFLKIAAASATALGVTGAVAVEAEASTQRPYSPEAVGMLYDSTKCIGCQTCVVKCHEINFLEKKDYVERAVAKNNGKLNFIQREDLIPKLAPEHKFNPQSPQLNVVTNDYRLRNIIQKYVAPNGDVHFIKHQCMHCNHPECVSVCPVAALTKDKVDGVIDYDPNICIGCRYCQMACPFLIPKFEWTRAVPKIVKCDMCKTTLGANGIEGTGCTNVCPTHAVIYGKRTDLMADAKARIANAPGKYFQDRVYGEKENGGTDVLYIAAIDFKELGFNEKISDYSYAEKSEKLQHTIYKWGIAPVALYTALAVIAYRNNKKHHNDEGDK